MDIHELYVGNDMLLDLARLRDTIDGSYLDAATVTVSLATQAGVPVVGESWPLALDYVTGSNGTYSATLRDTLELVPGVRYVATVNVDAGEGRTARWTMDCIARTRRA